MTTPPAPTIHPVQAALGSALAELRSAQDLTQVQLAALAGISPGVVSRIERGAQWPSRATLAALLDALAPDADLGPFARAFHRQIAHTPTTGPGPERSTR